MKDLNNIVVESIKKTDGIEIIKKFKKLGVDIGISLGLNCREEGHKRRYYGLIENKFNAFFIEDAINSNAKIITLDELKAMKEDKSEYPKLMWVGASQKEVDYKENKRVVFMNTKGYYYSWVTCDNMEDVENYIGVKHWKYAQDIEEEKPEPIEIKIPFNPHNGLTVIINNEEFELTKKTKQ